MLCTNARQNLSKVWDARHFVFKEIYVMNKDQKHWRDLYEFDTPVVRALVCSSKACLIRARYM